MIAKLKLIFITFLFIGFSASANKPYPNWPVIGSATLSVLWFDIYNAELSTDSGEYDPNGNLKLTLTYLRDFDAEDLITETFKQMPQPLNQTQQDNWQKQLNRLWPDVKEQDQISFVQNAQGVGYFYYNKRYLGEITDPEFATKFSAIWLADTSSYPKLAAKLKGQSK